MHKKFTDYLDDYFKNQKDAVAVRIDDDETMQNFIKLSKKIYINKANILWQELMQLSLAVRTLHEIDNNQFRGHLLDMFKRKVYDTYDLAFKGDPDDLLEPFGGYLYLSEPDHNINHFMAFMDEEGNYTPPPVPSGINEIAGQIFTLAMIFTQFKSPVLMPPSISLKLDYAMAQLLRESANAFYLIYEHGLAKSRTRKSTKVLSKKSSERRQMVIEEYYRIDNRSDKRPHTIAKEIHNNLKKRVPKEKKTPAITTIKDYLKQEGIF